MRPTERDRQTTRLPRFLAPLYMLARPWRLLREYGLGFQRRPKLDLAIYDPTPKEVVDEMLRLASVRPGDVLYDLGCGDGRIVVAAAEKYGIRGVEWTLARSASPKLMRMPPSWSGTPGAVSARRRQEGGNFRSNRRPRSIWAQTQI